MSSPPTPPRAGTRTPFRNRSRACGSTWQVPVPGDYCFTPHQGASAQIASLTPAAQPDPPTWRSLTTRNARRLFPHLATPDRT
ncbi:hypothetical protein [Streptomyces sp. NPDC058739]|uniref:hypothetical protein n=1 Tax=Streptomyces sp. NPDC058739 TaxID=3346618 RepID=UPI0036A4CC3E